MKPSRFFFIVALFVAFSCNRQPSNTSAKLKDPEILHQDQKNLTQLIIYDIFSPPVASRIYAYTSLAAHEALRHLNPGEPSIIGKLKGFPEMPQPDKNKNYDFVLAASKAFYTVAFNITFSKDSVRKFEDKTYTLFKKNLNSEVFENSLAFGEAVGNAVMQRAADDNYKKTRGMERYLGSFENGKWTPTAPDYLEGLEPYWKMIKSLTLDSSNQFDPGPPPPFSRDTASEFYKMVNEVYQIGKNLTQEQKDMAYFWDDNPFVLEHAGHMKFGTKKQTPGGHWMGIAAIACKKANTDIVRTARVYALTAVGLFDGFISCWETKYKYPYVRPITIINDWFDRRWEPYLQTPPHPEYTSGHSTISASAAIVLTGLFGENFAFHDDSNKEYIGMERDFTSFLQAANEVSVSRLYGGIHYLLSLDIGAEAGAKVGKHVLQIANSENP